MKRTTRELTPIEKEKFTKWYRQEFDEDADFRPNFWNYMVVDDAVMAMDESDYSGFKLFVVNLEDL